MEHIAGAWAERSVYREYDPEVLEEMQGIADGQGSPLENIADLLLPMYCFEPDHHYTAFAVADGTTMMLCKKSDFLVSLEKLYMNCLYALSGAHAFNGSATAFIQIEDGMNEKGLAEAMKEYRTPPDVDSWRAEERYDTARNALAEHGGAYSLDFCEDVLSGKYGFICQYDRKTNADAAW
ncbi:hypothetical protein SDC9_54581 [bioreactor metagenome]|uniref:Uncharacterized protein n=1 Tax=bioreactor metagenome TaxID=1076179 RepID=A0A644WWU5_9ZZZZ